MNFKFFMYIIFCCIFWGSSFPAGKYLVNNVGVPPFFLVGARFITAGIIVLVLHMLKSGVKSVLPRSNESKRKGFLVVLLVGIISITGVMSFTNLSLISIPAPTAAIISFTSPLWIALLSPYILGEKLTKLKIFAIVIGIIGVGIALGISIEGKAIGYFYALLNSLCNVIGIMIAKKTNFDNSMFLFAGWQMLFGGIIGGIISYIVGEHFDYRLLLHGYALLWIVWLIICSSIVAFTLWFSALNSAGATVTSSFTFLIPLFATLFSVLFTEQEATLHLVIGGIIVIIAIILVNKNPKVPVTVGD